MIGDQYSVNMTAWSSYILPHKVEGLCITVYKLFTQCGGTYLQIEAESQTALYPHIHCFKSSMLEYKGTTAKKKQPVTVQMIMDCTVNGSGGFPLTLTLTTRT